MLNKLKWPTTYTLQDLEAKAAVRALALCTAQLQDAEEIGEQLLWSFLAAMSGVLGLLLRCALSLASGEQITVKYRPCIQAAISCPELCIAPLVSQRLLPDMPDHLWEHSALACSYCIQHCQALTCA